MEEYHEGRKKKVSSGFGGRMKSRTDGSILRNRYHDIRHIGRPVRPIGGQKLQTMRLRPRVKQIHQNFRSIQEGIVDSIFILHCKISIWNPSDTIFGELLIICYWLFVISYRLLIRHCRSHVSDFIFPSDKVFNRQDHQFPITNTI